MLSYSFILVRKWSYQNGLYIVHYDMIIMVG